MSLRQRQKRKKAARANVVIAVQAVAMAAIKVANQRRSSSRLGCKTRKRVRVQVKDIYEQLGPVYFRRAYWMKYSSFKKLAKKLEAKIVEKSGKNQSSFFNATFPTGQSHHLCDLL
jgi:hypothetical protein